MSKRERRAARKAAKLAAKTQTTLPSSVAISAIKLDAALTRAANGKATVEDVDFLTRVRREQAGRDGYTGQSKVHGSGSHNGNFGFMSQNRSWYGDQKAKQDRFSFSTSPSKGEDGVFCVESNEVTKECPVAKEPKVLVDETVWATWISLAEEYSVEWIAHLMGVKEVKDGQTIYRIEKFYFPPQTASGAHVDVPTGIRPRAGVIGAIHSHVKMSCFFSGTDTAHSNWPVEIVVNARGEYKAVARHQLRCGEWAKTEAKVFTLKSKLFGASVKSLEDSFSKGKIIEAANRAKKMPSDSVVTPSQPIEAIVPSSIAEEDRQDVAEAIVKDAEGGDKDALSLLGVSDGTVDLSGYGTAITVPVEDDPTVVTPTSKDDGSDLDEEDYCKDCDGYSWVEVRDPARTGVLITKECPTCKGDGLSEKGRAKSAESMVH